MVRFADLHGERIVEILDALGAEATDHPFGDTARKVLIQSRLIWEDEPRNECYATPVGVLLLAEKPNLPYPQARLVVEYHEHRFDGSVTKPIPASFLETSEPLPSAIHRAIRFLEENTRAAFRVQGMQRFRVLEYPIAALREAVVNAVAHRDYQREGQPIRINLYRHDRVTITSPGGLLTGLSVKQLQHGNYQANSRNPGLAQGLRVLGLMEERGKGIQIMRDAMVGHGLTEPILEDREGDYFCVSLVGPGEAGLDAVTAEEVVWQPPERVRHALTEVQEKIVAHALEGNPITRRWCEESLGLAGSSAYSQLKKLQELGVLEKQGVGKATHYLIKSVYQSGPEG